MMLSKSLYRSLKRLLSGQTIAASSLRKELANELLDEGLLTVHAQGSRRTYAAIDRQALQAYLSAHYETLRDWTVAEQLSTKADNTRALQAVASGNSKLTSVRSCPGFPINSYEPLDCQLGGTPIEVYPPNGSFLFITDWRHFAIPSDVVVVGIENMENFRLVRWQREWFTRMLPGKRLLFVARYPQSTDLRSWLQTITNLYVHFGDFDLAGIHIFLAEFQAFLGDRASLLIPPDIEQRLSKGSTERYNAQYRKFKHLTSSIPSVQCLIDLINLYHRAYDQEGYIVQGMEKGAVQMDRL